MKCLGWEADLPPPLGAKVTYEWTYTFPCHIALMECQQTTAVFSYLSTPAHFLLKLLQPSLTNSVNWVTGFAFLFVSPNMLPVAHSPLYGHCGLTTVKTDI